jgi:predicted dehydrogenase
MFGIGVVGAGAWGSNWIRTLVSMPEVRLRGVCDLSRELLTRVHRQYPGLPTTNRIEDLLDDVEISGIVIATTAATHFALATQAILAGKHVLVEKPLTLRTVDALALQRLARDQGRLLMVGHLLEYHPAIVFIREMIASGELGEVQHIYSQRLNLGTVRMDENVWWSLAPHDIAVACRLLESRPVSVQCRGQSILQPDHADLAFAQLEFPEGKLAHIHVSWLDPHKARRMCIVGSKKMVNFDDTSRDGKIVVYDKGAQVLRSADGKIDRVGLRMGGTVLPWLDASEPLLHEARHFVDCVTKTQRPLSDAQSGARIVQVLECGQRSMDLGGVAVAIPNRLEGCLAA